jgi:hypothetical protein
VEEHLQEDVAELAANGGVIPLANRIVELVRFLVEVRAE